MRTLLSLLLLCGPLAAQPPSPADGEVEITVLPAAPAPAKESVPRWEPIPKDAAIGDIVPRYLEAFYPEEKVAALQKLAMLKPRTVRDMQALMALNNKDDAGAAAGIAASLGRLTAQDQHFAPFLMSLLRVDEPKIRMFALAGIERVRPEEALEILYKEAKTPFKERRLRGVQGRERAGEWLSRFHCLRILALWEGEKVLPLLYKRAKEAPRVGSLIAGHFWVRSFDDILRWSESRRQNNRELGLEAWRAAVPKEALRITRGRLLDLTLDRKKRDETRHQAAVKLGLSSNEDEVGLLLEKRSAAADKKTRVLLETAIFASRSKKAVPLLIDYVKKHEDPLSRGGALAQLGDLMPRPEFETLLRWVAEHDPDMENRRDAIRRLPKR